MKSFTLFTMKSKQVWMKSKPYGFDEIKSASPIPMKSDFIAKRFHPTQVGFLPPSADLVEKTVNLVSRLTVFSGSGRRI